MNIKTTIVEHQQGSEAWLQHRAISFNASELAAAMGISPYMTRTELIAQKATGLVPEVDAAKQRIFDNGHRYEAIARPWAEDIIGEELFPVVLAAEVDGMRLSASLDGQTMAGDITWEHKSLNDNLRQSLDAGVIPSEYHPQMEQGLMLSGASRCLFMASNGDRDTMRSAWYESQPELRAKIIPTWKQVQADAATYVPSVVTADKPTGKAPDTLPALRIEVTGMVTASNLAEFKETALAAIRGVNRDLTTDQDFADAEQSVKWCEEVESRLKAAKEHALSQTASIDQLFKTIDDISAEARKVRLELDKLVKARKDELRQGIVQAASRAYNAHLEKLTARIGWVPVRSTLPDFAGAVKGKRSLASIQDAVDTELARAKIAANDLADLMEANIKSLKGEAHDWSFLFPDLATVAAKPAEDFANLLAARIGSHKQAEEQRRQREAEAAAKAAQVVQQAAAAPAVNQEAPVVARTAPVASGATIKLGQINAYLAPIQINQAGLAQLGFDPVGKDKSAVLYRESDFPAMCRAIAKHAMSAMAMA